MKIAFCAPILDMSGFASASRAFLKTLHHAGCDLVVRPLKYDQADPGTEYQPEEWLKPLLVRPLEGIELLIQSTTPNIEAVPAPGICNAIYTFVETDRIPQHWVDKLNLFDFIIVSSRYNAVTLARCGVAKPIICMPVPYDLEVVEPLKADTPRLVPNAGKRTIFYNVSQLSSKKGIDLLTRAYFAAFYDRPDEVLLVLKTYINMAGRQGEHEAIKQYIQRIKQATRIPIEKWPPIQIISQTLTDEQIHQLHEECHAYVCASRSEGVNLPAFDSLAHGKILISNAHGGMADFVKPETALVVNGTLTHCFEQASADPYHMTGLSQVFETSTVELAALMRLYHSLRMANEQGVLDDKNLENWKAICQRQANGRLIAERHDYKLVSEKIFEQLQVAYSSWRENGRVIFPTQNVAANAVGSAAV